MHHKFCIIDEKVCINGSFNWTWTAANLNYENFVVSRSKEIIEQFSVVFRELWEDCMHFQLLRDVKEDMDQKVDYFEFGKERDGDRKDGKCIGGMESAEDEDNLEIGSSCLESLDGLSEVSQCEIRNNMDNTKLND
jgi:hypothetical protein